MADEEFPCRTKEIRGVNYRVKFYDQAGDLRMSTSYRDEKERAEKYVKRMVEACPQLRGEITEHPFTETVCIDCGQEVW
jgi:hypothetical protein